MIVFIIEYKRFDKKILKNKNLDLIYIFNNLNLYNELSKKYKCVNLDIFGRVKNQNFFPIEEKKNLSRLLHIKLDIYSYFKKKKLSFLRRNYIMRIRTYKDSQYRMVVSMAKNMAKFSKEEAIQFLDREILDTVFNIITNYDMQTPNLDKEKEKIGNLLNYTKSFFSSYIYSLGFKKDDVIFGDIFIYSYFLNTILYYKYDKYDVNIRGFKPYYLKVLSRLFIEKIHSNDIKSFIKTNIQYYKENGWL